MLLVLDDTGVEYDLFVVCADLEVGGGGGGRFVYSAGDE